MFLIGGGTKLENIVEVAKKCLRLPVSLGVNKNVASIIDKVNDTGYLNALGLVVWGNKLSENIGRSVLKLPGGVDVGRGVKKLKDWFKSLIP